MLTTTAVIFSNTHWTFWDVFLFVFLWVPLVMIWFFAILDVFRRPDLSGGARALWVLGIIIFPWLGTLVYLIARPKDLDSSYGVYGYNPAGYGAQDPGTVQTTSEGTPVASSPGPQS